MIKGAKRANAGFQHGVSDPPVMVDAFLIDGTRAEGLNSRPGDRETITLLVQPLEHGDVFFVVVVVIAGNVASSAAFYFTDGMRQSIPVDSPFPSVFHAPSTW